MAWQESSSPLEVLFNPIHDACQLVRMRFADVGTAKFNLLDNVLRGEVVLKFSRSFQMNMQISNTTSYVVQSSILKKTQFD